MKLGVREIDGITFPIDEHAEAYDWFKDEILRRAKVSPMITPIPLYGDLQPWIKEHAGIFLAFWYRGVTKILDWGNVTYEAFLYALQTKLVVHVANDDIPADHVFQALVEQMWRDPGFATQILSAYRAQKKQKAQAQKRKAEEDKWAELVESQQRYKKQRADAIRSLPEAYRLPHELVHLVAHYLPARDALSVVRTDRFLLAQYGNALPDFLFERDFILPLGEAWNRDLPTLLTLVELPAFRFMLRWIYSHRDPKQPVLWWFLVSGIAEDLFENENENLEDNLPEEDAHIHEFDHSSAMHEIVARYTSMTKAGGYNGRSWLRLCYRAVAYTMAVPMFTKYHTTAELIGSDGLHITFALNRQGSVRATFNADWRHERGVRVLDYLSKIKGDPKMYWTLHHFTDVLFFLLVDVDPTVELFYAHNLAFFHYEFNAIVPVMIRDMEVGTRLQNLNMMRTGLDTGLRYEFQHSLWYPEKTVDVDAPERHDLKLLFRPKHERLSGLFSEAWQDKFFDEVFDFL